MVVIKRAFGFAAATWFILGTALFQRLGLRRLYWALFRAGQPYQPLTRAELWRLYFERLGSTFIKFGQIIASSPGLFPRDLSEEFKKCLDRVPAFSTNEVKRILSEEFGRPWQQVYAEFEDTPIAAASIAQVHGAVLPDGETVVVKVQRPGIANRIDADMWYLRLGAKIAERFSVRARLSNLTGIVNDFEKTLHEELDFRTEAANMVEFNEIMQRHGVDEVVAPTPNRELTTMRVLTMERFHGFKADDVEAARAHGIDAEYYLRVGMRAWNLSLLLYGFFHGDVHAGNLMFLPEEKKVGFLDFGIIGRFDDTQRQQVMRYILAFTALDFEEVARILVEMGSVSDGVELAAFGADLRSVYEPLFSASLGDIQYGAILPQITQYSLKYGVHLPQEFVLILKQLLYFDRYAKLAAPDLNVFSDIYLIDFLFSPDAAKAGVDLTEVMGAMQKLQQRRAAEQKAKRKAAREAKKLAAADAEDSSEPSSPDPAAEETEKNTKPIMVSNG